MRKSFPVFLIVLLSACTPFVTSTPPPAPQPVRVAYTATLRPWIETLHQCALENPEIALITQETSGTNLDISAAELTLWFGEPAQGMLGYAAPLGEDEIVIIAGAGAALRNITAEQLRAFYTQMDSVYQVWTYNEGNELRAIFDRAVLGEEALTSFALLAPHPAAMLEAITADPQAIGYVPKSWLPGDVNEISIARELQTAFEQPVLALTTTEPVGNLRAYIVCLQNASP